MSWIPDSFRRRKLFQDLSDEMRIHLEERVEHLIGEGLSAIEAKRQARIAFGNLAMLEERSREVWRWPTLESIWADIRLAARQLRKSPGFAVTAVLTLAMAIGANAVVFGVMNGLILRPLNVPESQNLYSIDRAGDSDTSESYPDYLDMRERNRSFVDLAAYTISQWDLMRAVVQLQPGVSRQRETTLIRCESTPILAASSTLPTNTGRIVPPSWC
jgi:hypothetical protein